MLKPGWLLSDVHQCALAVAREEVSDAEREARNANDALADALSRLKAAKAKVRALERAQR